jgi:hypothetical protein
MTEAVMAGGAIVGWLANPIQHSRIQVTSSSQKYIQLGARWAVETVAKSEKWRVGSAEAQIRSTRQGTETRKRTPSFSSTWLVAL